MTQVTQFMHRVRARDQRCVISDWTLDYGDLQACHIIPRCHSAPVRDPLQSYSANTWGFSGFESSCIYTSHLPQSRTFGKDGTGLTALKTGFS